jgi:hypothetical protein
MLKVIYDSGDMPGSIKSFDFVATGFGVMRESPIIFLHNRLHVYASAY